MADPNAKDEELFQVVDVGAIEACVPNNAELNQSCITAECWGCRVNAPVERDGSAGSTPAKP